MIGSVSVKVRRVGASSLARLAYTYDRVVSAADRVRGVAPTVLGPNETSRRLLDERTPISRLGDGEFLIIFGKSIGYQKYDPILAARLAEVLQSNEPNHMVAIPDVFGQNLGATSEQRSYWQQHLARYRHRYLKVLDLKKVYYDASTTRVMSRMQDAELAHDFFRECRALWRDRDVIFVEGDKTRLGVGNDLFSDARSIRRIIAPAENAFSRYEEILTVARDQDITSLFIISLGPTATVLSCDLARMGFQALDLGHFDIEYEWTRTGSSNVLVPGKYVNEVVGGRQVGELDDDLYVRQIVQRIW